MSQFAVDAYEVAGRPVVQAAVTPATADALLHLHPLRLRRYMLSDRNPAMAPIEALASTVKEARRPADPVNPFVQAERQFGAAVETAMKAGRDLVDAWQEITFFGLWANPLLSRLAEPERAGIGAAIGQSLQELPAVQAALMNIERGGYAEALIRMLILMARSRGEVRQSRLERSNAMLNSAEPFRSLGADRRAQLIAEQTLIVDFAPEAAVTTLPTLLPQPEERERAIAMVQEIAGDLAEMSEPTLRMLTRLRETLALSPLMLGTVPEPAGGQPARRRTRTTESEPVAGE
jgi:hypothetical protein